MVKDHTSDVGETEAPQIAQKRALDLCSCPQGKSRGASERTTLGARGVLDAAGSGRTFCTDGSLEAGDGKIGDVSPELATSTWTESVSSEAKCSSRSRWTNM